MIQNRKIVLFNFKWETEAMRLFPAPSFIVNARTFSITRDLLSNDNNNPEENSNITSSNINDTDTSNINSDDTNNYDADVSDNSEKINPDYADNTSSSDISDVFERYKDRPEEELDDYMQDKCDKLRKTYGEDTARNIAENGSDPDEFRIRKEEINKTFDNRMEAAFERWDILTTKHNDYNNNQSPSSAAESSASGSSAEESPAGQMPEQEQTPAANQETPLDFVIQLESTEMPDIYSADGGD